MATRGLLEMLDAAIGIPRVGVVDLVALHELLKAIIIGQQGQQELSVLEPGQSPTLGLGKGKVTKEKPGQEEKERDICKKRASLQELWEEINKFKEAQCGLAEDMRAMQKAHSGMAEDMREMQEAMQKAHSGMAQDMQEMKDAHSGLAEDIQEIQETLGLRGSFSSQATIPGDAQEPAKPWHCSGSIITSSYELEMQELLSQVGQLGHLCTGVKDQVKQLKSAKAERADLEDVRGLFPKGGRQSITSILSYLKCQMSFLQDMARTLHGEEEKSLQQDEQLKRLQASIVQLQKDYGKLSSALANLQYDRQQEHNDIKKADKAALADKVSCSQFEACVERLNEMMEEVTSRVTGQEKGWQRFQQELQRQMDCKELPSPFLPPPGSSCLVSIACHGDRPVTMLVPGLERTGQCKYPTVLRSCGGPHTVRPPRFQPQPPSTPRPPPSSARCPNKKDTMQLSGQDGTDGNPQDEQLSMMGASQLSTTPRATLNTSTSSSRPSMALSGATLRGLMMLKMSCLVETMPSSPPLRLLGARGQRQESREEET
ncbi:hypothetical protein Q9233_016794 [Columba guinea]|nr:hypothetical protein Q9233_016794 [Columba guinea]